MKRYQDIPLTGLTKLSRRHAREIQPPSVQEASNVYLSRSDSCPQIRPPMSPIDDTLTSIVLDDLQFLSTDDESDYVNGYFYSWGVGHGIYFTRFGPVFDTTATSDVLYAVYDTGTMTSTSESKTIVFNDEDVDLLTYVWPGCILKYTTGGVNYFYEIIAVNSKNTLVVSVSPGNLTEVDYEILRIHDINKTDYPFHIDQFGINVLYSAPSFTLPMEPKKISGPFYMNLQDYETASSWTDMGDLSSGEISVSGFSSPMYMLPTELYDRGMPNKIELPLSFRGTEDSFLYCASSVYMANAWSGFVDGPSRLITIERGTLEDGYPINLKTNNSNVGRIDPLNGKGAPDDTSTVYEDDFDPDPVSNYNEIITDANFTWNYNTAIFGVPGSSAMGTVPGAVTTPTWELTEDTTSTSTADFEATCSFLSRVGGGATYAAIDNHVGLAFRLDNTGVDGYAFSFEMPSAKPDASDVGTLKLLKFASSVKSTLATKVTTLSTDTTYTDTSSWTWYNSALFKMRVNVSGSTFKARVWLAAGTEPATWDIVHTDTSFPAAGKFGMYMLADNSSSGPTSNVRPIMSEISATSEPGYYSFNNAIVTCSAYGSLANKDVSLFAGYDNGNITSILLNPNYGIETGDPLDAWQHRVGTLEATTPVISSNRGNRTRINKIRHVGYALPVNGDTTVYACCDGGILVYDCANGSEVDTGAGASLNDIASSRRKLSAGSPAIDGDLCAVGAGGVIETCDAKVDPKTAGNWTARTSGTTADLRHVFWSRHNSKFVAFGNQGAVTLSDDAVGSTWTVKADPNSGENITAAATDSMGRVFAIVTADGKAFITDDFTTYTEVTGLDGTPADVYFSERTSTFFIGGDSGYIEVFAAVYNLDSQAVTNTTALPEYINTATYYNSLFLYSSSDGISKASTFGGALTEVESDSMSNGNFADNGSLVVHYRYRNGTLSSYYSSDGTSWSNAVIAEVEGLGSSGSKRLHYDSSSGEFVLLLYKSDKLYHSTDAITWTSVDLPTNFECRFVGLVDNSEIRADITTAYDDIVICGENRTTSNTSTLIARWDGVSTYTITEYDRDEITHDVYDAAFDGSTSYGAGAFNGGVRRVGLINQEYDAYNYLGSYSTTDATGQTRYQFPGSGKNVWQAFRYGGLYYVGKMGNVGMLSSDMMWFSSTFTDIGGSGNPPTVFNVGTDVYFFELFKPDGTSSYDSYGKKIASAASLAVLKYSA